MGDVDRGDIVNVLLVDDSALTCELMEQRLSAVADSTLHLNIQVANSGVKAIEMAKAQPFDIVFLDVVMPDLDGYEVCRRLKKVRHVRVVMLSGRTAANDHLAGRDAGCDNYLTKPPRDTDLRTILRLVSLQKLIGSGVLQ